MDVENKDIGSIRPYGRNPRKIPAAAIDKVAASIQEFGWRQPIVVDSKGTILVGHTRFLAAQKLGMKTVPVHVAKGLSKAQKQAYRIADNRTGQESTWDTDLLKLEMADLKGLEFDLDLTGFDINEVDRHLRGIGGEDEDAVPEVEAEVVSRTGDVWLLGDHRLMCGSAKSLDWMGLMTSVFGAAPLAPDAQVLVNLGMVHHDGEWTPYWQPWIDWMQEQGWRRFGWYVWDKGPGLPGNWAGRLAPAHEWVFHLNKKSRKLHATTKTSEPGSKLVGGGLRARDGKIPLKTGVDKPTGTMRVADSVFRVMAHKGGIGEAGKHPAVFPVALADEVLAAFSSRGEVVYEPFCGSGSQIIAADKIGRHCYAMEIVPGYVDVAVRRWQLATGGTAVREGDGATIDAAG